MRDDAKTYFTRKDTARIEDSAVRSGRKLSNGFSLSGGERDHLFLSAAGQQFYDVAGVAGLADPADGRVVSLLDLDRDGWRDLAVTNANAPSFRLYRNQIGERGAAAAKGGMIALRFVGANHSAKASKLSNRDAYGTLVTVQLDDKTLIRELRAGEGYSAQNSSTMIVGIGKSETANVTVRFPSGTEQQRRNVQAGSLLTVYEWPQQSSSGEAFIVTRYIKANARPRVSKAGGHKLVNFAPEPDDDGRPQLVMYTTMATWCEACKRETPQLRRLRQRFTGVQLVMRGLPIDIDNDGDDELAAYVAKYKPAYELLTTRTSQQVEEIQQLLRSRLMLDALPATVVTDADAVVVATMFGVPSASDIQRLLASQSQE